MSNQNELEQLMIALLSMDDEQLEEESEIFNETLERTTNEESINQRIVEIRNTGLTEQDLEEEIQAFEDAYDMLGKLSPVKRKFITKIIDVAKDFNKKIIAKSLRKHINVPIEVCKEGAVLPSYAREGDAGVDLCSCEDLIIPAGITKIVPTGLKMAIPNGFELQVRPRSGNSLKESWQGIIIANSPGTVDAGYRDEIGIIVRNFGQVPFAIARGDKIAQGVLKEVPKMIFKEVPCVEDIGKNRGGGFGHTDKDNA